MAESGTGFSSIWSEGVNEANWEWMKAEGFRPYWTGPAEEKATRRKLKEAFDAFGINNVLMGNVFNSDSDRPLRHIPGVTIYVRDESPVERH